jgi:hypothetical protein
MRVHAWEEESRTGFFFLPSFFILLPESNELGSGSTWEWQFCGKKKEKEGRVIYLFSGNGREAGRWQFLRREE